MYDMTHRAAAGLGLSWDDIKEGAGIVDTAVGWFKQGPGGPQGAVSISAQLPVFLRAWEASTAEARAALLRAAVNANAAGRWATEAEVDAEPEEFVRAANGGSDGKITTSSGKQFNAVYMAFLQRFGASGTVTPGPHDPYGGGGGIQLPGWLVDGLTPRGGEGGGGGGGGGGLPVVPLAIGAGVLLLLLMRRR